MINEYLLSSQFPAMDLGDIILREITDDDAQAYLDYMNREAMRPFVIKSNIPQNIDQATEEVRYWGSLFRNNRSFYWAIALKEDNKLVGTAGFNSISINHVKGEISYDLDSNYWGRGIMLKSVKNILKFADLALNLVRIQATVIQDNERSVKLLERCGFQKEGALKKYEVVDGDHRDYYIYARVH